MAVCVHGHGDGGVAQSLLYDLGRQLQAAIGSPVDAPARIEMAERMEASVFRAAVFRCHLGGNLGGDQAAPDDVLKARDGAFGGWENKIMLALGTRELPFLESRQNVRP